MDSDQFRVALILSGLAGLMLGFISFVFVSGVREHTIPIHRTSTPAVVPTPSEIPLLPSRRVLTITPSTTLVNTPIPTNSPYPIPEVTRTSLSPPATKALSAETTNWVIVTGSYLLLREASADSVRFQQAGYSVTLFLRDGIFRSTIIGYPTITDAREPLEDIRLTLADEAYLRDLRVWCPEWIQQSGYLACER